MVSTVLRRISVACACLALAAAAAAQQLTLPLEKGSVRFAVIGDAGTGNQMQYDTAEQLTRVQQKFPFEFVLMMGDNIYGGKSPNDFEKKFALPYKALLDAGIKFYASLGNHDVPEEQAYKPFNMDGHRYYTFKKGKARFFALDSNYMDPEQLKWLESELRGSTDDWKIAFFHHALYSSGAYHGSALELRRILEPLFQKYGVQVVLSGHDHIYERIEEQQGIHYFVEGASGQLRRGDARGASFTAKAFDEDCTFMLVEIAGDVLYFQTIARTGATVDSGSFRRAGQAASAAPGR